MTSNLSDLRSERASRPLPSEGRGREFESRRVRQHFRRFSRPLFAFATPGSSVTEREHTQTSALSLHKRSAIVPEAGR